MRGWFIALVATGCTGSSNDSEPPPPGPESECSATAPGVVRVHSTGFDEIYFTHDATGALVERHDAGTSKLLDLVVPPCGAVTWLERTRTFFETTTQLVDGDELYTFLGSPFVQPQQAEIVIDTPLTGASTYVAYGGDGCSGSGTSNISMSYTSDCTSGDGKGTIVVVPYGTPPPFAFAVFENVNFAATRTSPLHVTQWQTTAPQHQIALDLDSAPLAVDCFVGSLRGVLQYSLNQIVVQQPTATSTLDVQFAEFGDGHVYVCEVVRDANRRTYFARKSGAMAAFVTIAEADLLSAVVDAGVVLDAARPTIEFTVDREGAEEDVVMGAMFGISSDGSQQMSWRGVAPPGTRSFRVPELPADLAPVFEVPEPILSLYESTITAGYHDAIHDTTPFMISRYALPLQTLRMTEFPRQP
jgi:hypothetical protein